MQMAEEKRKTDAPQGQPVESTAKSARRQEAERLLGGKVGIGAYIALIAAIIFFSGILMKVDGMKWLSAFDYTTLIGKYGTMKVPEKATWLGMGGFSARQGFLFALSLAPSVMLALGVIEVLAQYGAIRAAHKLMTPLLKPILGLPGLTGLALITDLQSTDAGAAQTKELFDEGLINDKEHTIMTAWQYSGAGMISNYFATGSAVFAALTVPVILPLGIIFVMKFVGGAFVRFMLNTVYGKDFADE